jgi:tetratricopeptide (TPR) repeat protein
VSPSTADGSSPGLPIPELSGDPIGEALAAEQRLHWRAAAEAWGRASAALPGDHRLLTNQAHALWLADEPTAALVLCERALRLQPEAALTHRNRANILRDLNRFEEADAAYAETSRLEGGGAPITAWSHSQTLIGLERYEEAYRLAERRFGVTSLGAWRPGPYWQGWPEGAPTASPPPEVVVWNEQGLGDTLQYVRWVPSLVARGVRVRLEVEPVLVPLLREGLARLGDSLTVAPQGLWPRPLQAPCQGSLLSLPHRLGGAPLPEAFAGADSSEGGRGYLRSPRWRSPAKAGGPARVGLVWASGRKLADGFMAREYERRSLPGDALRQLLEGLERAGRQLGGDTPALELVCLQLGGDRRLADAWGGRFAAELPQGASFADTATLLAGLDLVITVDTASAHLVGALALPGWVLLPWGSDPRWLRGREDSPWYPTLTLLRQPSHRDWPSLVRLVLERFQPWLGQRSAG